RVVRAGLALTLSVFWLGSLAPPADLGVLTRPGVTAWLVLGLALGREAILGALMGVAFALLLAPARIAGEMVAQQIGLAQGQVLGPGADTAAGPLTLILETLAGLVFLEMDLHHVVLGILHVSFERFPLGGTLLPSPTGQLVDGVAMAESLGVLLAGPLALCLFLVTVILALMARI